MAKQKASILGIVMGLVVLAMCAISIVGLAVDERLSHFTRDGRTMRDSAEFTAAVDAACADADRSRLRYFAKFRRPGRELGDIVCICAPTEHDNDYELHADLARIYL